MQLRYVFCLDTSHQAVESGFFLQSLQSIKACLDYIQYPEKVGINLFTFDSALTFY